ncbi:hypothetical protein HMPREF2532_03568 [Bacteroides ovatus]|nr:hypothetical protein HMPREF2532_03568 [Bacteroides ovatus]
MIIYPIIIFIVTVQEYREKSGCIIQQFSLYFRIQNVQFLLI